METLAREAGAWAHGQVTGGGRFAPAGTGAPTYPDTDHPGWSVARTGVGAYRVTFDRRYAHVICVLISTQMAAGNDSSYQLVSITQPTATALGFFDVRHWDFSAAAVAEVAADAANQCHFIAVLSENEKLV